MAKVNTKSNVVALRKPANVKLALHNEIYLIINHQLVSNMISTTGVFALVSGETEKAWQLNAIAKDGNLTGRTCWFPKVALIENDRGTIELAKWFKPNNYTAKWFYYNSQESNVYFDSPKPKQTETPAKPSKKTYRNKADCQSEVDRLNNNRKRDNFEYVVGINYDWSNGGKVTGYYVGMVSND